MKKSTSREQQWVHKFTEPTFMKFVPKRDFELPDQKSSVTLADSVRRFFTSLIPTAPASKVIASGSKPEGEKKNSERGQNRLRYVRSLTSDDFLVGNEDQLDGIQVSGIMDGFVDTDYLWSMGISKPILHVEVDSRKGYILLLTQTDLLVYQFRPKTIRESPLLLAGLRLQQEVRFLQVLKEGTVVLCFPLGVEVYSVEENTKSMRLTAKKQYNLGAGTGKLKLFQVPQPCDNILNVFFEEIKGEVFGLWCLEIEFSAKEVRMGKVGKIYEFPLEVKPSLLLQNYSREVYFINTGEELHAIRKGYRVDSARVNQHTEDSHLKFFQPASLLHLSAAKLQLYRLSLTATTPAKIALASTDSLEIPSPDFQDTYEYLEAVQLNGDNFGIFFQSRRGCNLRLKGQIKYCFVVSHFVRLEEKIQTVLPLQVRALNQQHIEERADMAAKMGLQRKNIYLRLWNNSGKNDLEDFKLLLDTLDYDTIRAEIEKKLKKNSMNYRQVILIEQGCQAMLAQNIFGEECNKDHLRNYMVSHLLARKLQFYRQMSEIQREGRADQGEEGMLMINIQNYNHYRTLDIRGLFLELVGQLCNEEKNTTAKIRALLKHFRFPLKVIYLELLADVITSTKKKFLKLLQAVPELLPCQGHPEGVWAATEQEQWQRSLYMDTVVTIQNRECVEEFCQSVWFKRYWLTQHDYVNLTKLQLEELHAKNASDAPFLRVLECVFDVVKEQPALRTIVDLLQDSYPRLPNHLLGKVFLYHRLHEHLKAAQPPSGPQEERVGRFDDFLRWKDPQVFKAMFAAQKLRKGFILKQMKDLFGRQSSAETFPEGLLNYFASPLSKISDIKYLLNRMNNQKRQFHEQNEGLYEVLVRGMQLKLTLGACDDVPAEEVLIYIENIPLPQRNPVFRDLETLRAINRQAKRFREMKLNMSIFTITKNMEKVIAAVVAHRVALAEVEKMTDYAALKEVSYVIVEDVISLKQNLYESSDDNRIVGFIYLAKLCEWQALLPLVGKLIEQQWFLKLGVTPDQLEGLVLYMYKWRMTSQPVYQENASYLNALTQLLPQASPCRRFIQAQIEIALMLGYPTAPIGYPLSNGREYFTSSELERLISRMNGKQLLQLDVGKLQRLNELVSTVQSLATDGCNPELHMKQVYEMVVMRMLQCGELVAALPRVRQLVELCSQSKINFVYPCLIIARLAPELVEENKNVLLECASHLVGRPMELINLLKKMVKMASTTTEQRKFLANALHQAKKQSQLAYNPENPLIEKLYITLSETDAKRENNNLILKNWHRHAIHIKQEFNSVHFSLAFIMLCHDPYVLPSYLFSVRYEIDWRNFRAFLSHLTKEDFFKKTVLVQFARRVFLILYEGVRQNKSVEDLSELYRKMPLEQEKNFERPNKTQDGLQRALIESIDRMKAKAKSVSAELDRKWGKGMLEKPQEKQKRIKERLGNLVNEVLTNDYPFVDSDDNGKVPFKIRRTLQQDEKTVLEFNASFERATLASKEGSSLKPYLSPQLQKQMKAKFQAERQQRNNIFKNLSIDRQKPRQLQLNDAIRNSIRRSRSRSRNRETPPENHSSHKSIQFLGVRPNIPTPPQEKDSQLSVNLRSELRVNEQKLEVISLQMPEESKGSETLLEVLPELPLEGKQTDHEQVHFRQADIQQINNVIEVQDVKQPQKMEINEAVEVEVPNQMEVVANQEIVNDQIFQRVTSEEIQTNVPETGDTLAQIKLINLIIDGRTPLTDQTVLDFAVLDQYLNHPDFRTLLEELVTTIYHKTDISLAQVLIFIRGLVNAFPILNINKPFLEIYDRAEKLQTKFNLDLPLHSLFGPEGLMLQSQNNDALFRYLLPRIVGQLDEEQLIKACKVVTLSFKKSDLEQEIMLHYLMALLSRFQREGDNPTVGPREREMLREKIEAVLAKIPVRLLGKREEEVMSKLSDQSVREATAKMMIDSCRARYDTKVADHLEGKYFPQLKQ